MPEVELRVGEGWEQEAAQVVVEAALDGGHIALGGGSTPRPVHERVAALLPTWHATDLWWGDERCVPPDHELSNYRMARETLLDRIAIAEERVHRIRGELPPAEAAALYDEELRGVTLRLAFLGLGADGHTASLFPGSPVLDEGGRLAAPAEGPDVPRVTMTLPMLRTARTVLFLAVGAEKAEAAARAFAGAPSPDTPASLVRGLERTVVVLDPAAGALLPR